MKLTEKRLKELGFKCEREKNKKEDLDAIWMNEACVTLYQSAWGKGEFMFATRVSGDGEFKSGNVIATDTQLALLCEGITGKKLKL